MTLDETEMCLRCPCCLKQFQYTSLGSDHEWGLDHRERKFLIREMVEEDHPLIADEWLGHAITIVRNGDGRKWIFAPCMRWENSDEFARRCLDQLQNPDETLGLVREFPDGRNDAVKALRAYKAQLASTKEQARIKELSRISYVLGRMAGAELLDYHEIGEALWNASMANGLIADRGAELFRKIFNSVFFAGEKIPLSDPRRLSQIDPQITAGLLAEAQVPHRI